LKEKHESLYQKLKGLENTLQEWDDTIKKFKKAYNDLVMLPMMIG
jgi:hypothetical protein